MKRTLTLGIAFAFLFAIFASFSPVQAQQGSTANTGTTGTNGTNGQSGQTGSTGQTGTNGTNGTNSSTGTNGTTGQTGTTGTTGQAGTGQPIQKTDVLDDIRKLLGSSPLQVPRTDVINPIGAQTARVGANVSFKAIGKMADDTIIYSLEQAPPDATIDPTTGMFNWTPTQPGVFKFNVVATGTKDPKRMVKQLITITVAKPLENYGYDFFMAPRTMILARIAALGNPGQMTAPVSLHPQDSRNQQGQNNGQTGQNDQASGNQTNAGTTSGTGTTGTNGQTGLSGTTGTSGTGQTGNTGTNGATGANGTTGTNGNTNQNNALPPLINGVPQGIVPNSQGQPNFTNQNTADLLRYLVGPFDMMGNNVFVPSPERYQLGPGDTLLIRWWSPTYAAEERTIRLDSRGALTLPVGGQILVLRGQTLDQAERTLTKAFATQLRAVQVSVQLRELRSMQISVIGDAFMPGSYQVPSVATLFNVLYLVGGPNDNGSLRNIELRRTDGTRRHFDLYQFLIFGDSSQDVNLQPGDTIFIPSVQSRVQVDGEVGRPATYELIGGEHIQDLIKIAGGVKESGVAKRVSLSTVEPGVGRKLVDVDLGKPSDNPPVYGGDSINVFSIRPVLTNVVTIEGAVDQPGQYALSPGLKVSTLLNRARGVVPEAYLQRADLYRQNPDESSTLIQLDLKKILAGDASADIELKLNDRVRVYRIDEAMWIGDRQVFVVGAVRRPGTYPRQDGMRVIDLLLQAGGTTGEAFLDQGFVQHFNSDGTVGNVIKVDFRRAATGDESQNVALSDRDVLTVFTTQEAKFVPEQQISILGAVQRPGAYPAAPNMTIKDLIDLAGGLLPSAAGSIEVAKSRVPQGTQATRFNTGEALGASSAKLEAGDTVSVPSRGDFMDKPRIVYVLGAVKQPGYYAVNSTTDRISDIVTRAGGLGANAFPKGTQFYRNPTLLKSLAQERLSPRIIDTINVVAAQEYDRAVAKSQVEQARLQKSINSTPLVNVPTLTGVNTSQSSGGTVKIEGNPVTPARTLGDADLEPGGNFDVNMEGALRSPKGRDDLILMDGDIIIVPETPSHVNVVGAVTVPQSVVYQPGKNLQYYIDRCGGYLLDAGIKNLLIIRANGQVVRGTGRTRIELGDMIMVPTKVMAEKLTDRQAEIDSVTRNITAAGVMYAIIRSILK